MSIDVECKCGHRIHIPDGWKSGSTVCANCGKSVSILPESAPVAASRICPVCGTKFLPHESWCTHCKATFDELTSWRRDPHQAVEAGKCPACCRSILPYESACRRCHVVVRDYLDAWQENQKNPKARMCRICGKQLLPQETACPNCKTRVDATGGEAN